MKTIFKAIFAAAALSATTCFALTTGQPAPNFTAKDMKGQTITLKQYAGKPVVLEWTNKNCPYVKKFYGSNNMQALQKKYTGDGVVWLTVISSAPGKSGNMSPTQAQQYYKNTDATAVILDPSGALGKQYVAKTTPHMYIINQKGVLVYQGAIDSNSSADPKTIPTATSYISEALNDVLANKPVKIAQTKPYGCSVKY